MKAFVTRVPLANPLIPRITSLRFLQFPKKCIGFVNINEQISNPAKPFDPSTIPKLFSEILEDNEFEDKLEVF